MKVSEVGEFGLLERIKPYQGKGLKAGIGEDAAVIPFGPLDLLVTTDQMVEGVHFRKQWAPPEALGHKLLAVNLSDLAACGAEPLAFVVSLALRPEEEVSYVEALYRGMVLLGERFGVALAGGDTSRGEILTLSLTLLGWTEADSWIGRGGARPGDLLFLSGRIGEAALGLKMLELGIFEGPFPRRHLFPEPRVRLGRELAKRGIPRAMIDISDGFLQDLGHILRASGVGAEVHLESIPLGEEYLEACKELGLEPFLLALAGGEDYELLFVVPEEKEEEALQVGREVGVEVRRVGRITSEGMRLFLEGRPYPLPARLGHDHLWARPS